MSGPGHNNPRLTLVLMRSIGRPRSRPPPSFPHRADTCAAPDRHRTLIRSVSLKTASSSAAPILSPMLRPLLPKIDQRDADGLLLRRSNSVLAVEILATTSPEWWATATPEMQEDWIRSTVDWLAEAWGGRENLAHIELHVDETTPHITGYAVPLDERGALNCRKFIGEKQQLRDQQTGYALAVEHLGLQRGLPGRKPRTKP